MILEITERGEWTSILESMDRHDFYHTFDYHRLSRSPGDRPVLLVYSDGRAMIALPLIHRPIPGTGLFDATSVYGYPGPVSAGLSPTFDSTGFSEGLSAYFRAQNVVSVFSRLNPYIPYQGPILAKMGSLDMAGRIVGIDLALGAAQQRQGYFRRLKTQLNRARREIRVRQGEGFDDILAFADIYEESMRRLGADRRYCFPLEYFMDLFGSDQIGAGLLLAECRSTGEIMAGSIFTVTGDIAQYHLGGTATRFMRRMPSKLLIDEMRVRLADSGVRYFNLGGGVGCDDDGVFRFKRSFSPCTRSFSLWRYVVDQKAYRSLVELRSAQGSPTGLSFPGYRG